MTRKKQDNLSNTMPADQWTKQRAAERITHKAPSAMPLVNSTTTGRYEGKELHYRGRA